MSERRNFVELDHDIYNLYILHCNARIDYYFIRLLLISICKY